MRPMPPPFLPSSPVFLCRSQPSLSLLLYRSSLVPPWKPANRDLPRHRRQPRPRHRAEPATQPAGDLDLRATPTPPLPRSTTGGLVAQRSAMADARSSPPLPDPASSGPPPPDPRRCLHFKLRCSKSRSPATPAASCASQENLARVGSTRAPRQRLQRP